MIPRCARNHVLVLDKGPTLRVGPLRWRRALARRYKKIGGVFKRWATTANAAWQETDIVGAQARAYATKAGPLPLACGELNFVVGEFLVHVGNFDFWHVAVRAVLGGGWARLLGVLRAGGLRGRTTMATETFCVVG